MRRYFDLHLQNLLGACGRLARQPFATLLTVLVIAIAMALPAGLRVFVNNAGALSGEWQSAADFTVYFKTDVPTDRARAVTHQLEARADVASVRFIDRSSALAEFRAHSGFGDALEALDGNPLPDTVVVRPASGVSGDVEALAAAIDALPETDLVQLDTQWVARLRAMLALAGRIVDLATGLLALAVAIVVGNTIRLEINNRSTEIEVTKLVGGTDAFVRRPFLYLGVCYGLAGAVLAELLVRRDARAHRITRPRARGALWQRFRARGPVAARKPRAPRRRNAARVGGRRPCDRAPSSRDRAQIVFHGPSKRTGSLSAGHGASGAALPASPGPGRSGSGGVTRAPSPRHCWAVARFRRERMRLLAL